MAGFLQNLIVQKFFDDFLDNVDYSLRFLCHVTSCGSFFIVAVVFDCLVKDIESIIFTRTTNWGEYQNAVQNMATEAAYGVKIGMLTFDYSAENVNRDHFAFFVEQTQLIFLILYLVSESFLL